jgi:hypothetical protein
MVLSCGDATAVGRCGDGCFNAVNWKTGLIALLVVGAVAGGIVFSRNRARPPVTVTLRLAVTPPDKTDLVAGYANSSRFKYLMAKKAGVKPVLAQKLSVKTLSNSTDLEAQVGVETRDEGQRYIDGFVETLQGLLENQARLALSGQSMK